MAVRPFTKEEKTFMLKNYNTMSSEKMAIALNRSESGVKGFLRGQGIKRIKEASPLNDLITNLIEANLTNTHIIQKVKEELNEDINSARVTYYRRKIKTTREKNTFSYSKTMEIKELEARRYTTIINNYKKQVRIGSKITFKFKDKIITREVIEIYSNFVYVQLKEGRKESVMYKEIRKLI